MEQNRHNENTMSCFRSPKWFAYLHDEAQVVPGHVVVGVKPDGGPEGHLGQSWAAELKVHQAEALQTVQ